MCIMSLHFTPRRRGLAASIIYFEHFHSHFTVQLFLFDIFQLSNLNEKNMIVSIATNFFFKNIN